MFLSIDNNDLFFVGYAVQGFLLNSVRVGSPADVRGVKFKIK